MNSRLVFSLYSHAMGDAPRRPAADRV